MKILVLDNYDSFTYNLVQQLKELTLGKIDVYRNDAIHIDAVAAYDLIVLSPGPGLPKDAGILLQIVQKYGARIPILGICLGHQAIAEVYGASLSNLQQVYHGIATPIRIVSHRGLFKGQAACITVGRYHSWVVDQQQFPACLEITAFDEKGYIMALRHKEHPVFGLQFHPESVLTPDGKALLYNFVQTVSKVTSLI